VELLQTECVESSCIESLWTAGRSLGMLPPQGAGLGVPTASKTRPSGSTSDQFGEVTQKFQLFPPAGARRGLGRFQKKCPKTSRENLGDPILTNQRDVPVLYSAGRSQEPFTLVFVGELRRSKRRMLPDEAKAAAAAEGLELVLSSNSETGFRCVSKHSGNYQVQIKENGKRRHLGIFATPEEAALCFARHQAAERVAADAAQARHTRHSKQGIPGVAVHAAKVRQTNSRDAFTAGQKEILCEAFAHTARPSDEQMRELSTQLGLTARQVQVWFQNRRARFGSASAPEPTEAAEARVERRPQSLAVGEARAVSAGEARVATPNNWEQKVLATAAAAEARAAAAAAARAAAAEARAAAAAKARAAAAAEGLELVVEQSVGSVVSGVVFRWGKYKAQIRENGTLRHLGMFSTPEEAALCYARHVRAERAAAEAAEARASRPQSLPADEARTAAAEGPTLVPLLGSETGYKGVHKQSGKNHAPIVEKGKKCQRGALTTPEAASSYARHARPYRSAAETAEEAAAFKVGERVVVWFEDVGWFPGVVDAIAQHSARQRYEVSFDDGDHRTDVRPIEMRLESPMHMNAESQSQSAMEQRVMVERPQLLTGALAATNLVLSSRGKPGSITGSKVVMKDKSSCTAFTSEDGKPHQRFREVSTSEMQPVDEARAAMSRWMRPKVGDRIQGKYQGQIGGRNWYDGVVTAVHEDGTCDLHYDDGDHEERVAPRFIKVIASAMDAPLPRPPSRTASLDAQPRPASSGSRCKICRLGHGSCRRRGTPGHLEETEELPRDSHSHLEGTEEREELEELDEASELGAEGVSNQPRKRGILVTPEEAALCSARHIGAERAAAAVAEARGEGPKPLPADESAEGSEMPMESPEAERHLPLKKRKLGPEAG